MTTENLDALAAQAQAIEAPNPENASPGIEGEAANVPAITNEQALAGALAAGREAFCLFTKLQSPKQTLDDATITQLAGLWGPVLTKHGINVGGMLGDYALEIAAAIGTFGIAAAVRAGVNAEIAALKKQAENNQAQGQQAQANTVETIDATT